METTTPTATPELTQFSTMLQKPPITQVKKRRLASNRHDVSIKLAIELMNCGHELSAYTLEALQAVSCCDQEWSHWGQSLTFPITINVNGKDKEIDLSAIVGFGDPLYREREDLSGTEQVAIVKASVNWPSYGSLPVEVANEVLQRWLFISTTLDRLAAKVNEEHEIIDGFISHEQAAIDRLALRREADDMHARSACTKLFREQNYKNMKVNGVREVWIEPKYKGYETLAKKPGNHYNFEVGNSNGVYRRYTAAISEQIGDMKLISITFIRTS